VERQAALFLQFTPCGVAPLAKGARLPALRLRHFSIPGRAFQGIFALISQLLAEGP
jgi:hypothetical protein